MTVPTRVLIYDDMNESRKRYHQIFSEAEYKLILFSAPFDAKQKETIRTFAPELIIVDLLMGQSWRDGIEVLTQIKKLRLSPKPRIVICSKLIGTNPNNDPWADSIKKLNIVDKQVSKLTNLNLESFLGEN